MRKKFLFFSCSSQIIELIVNYAPVGSSVSLFNYPNDVAVNSNGNVYIADSFNNRIQLWPVNASSGIASDNDE